ncbi:hypothetical protein [Acinetobacter sp. V2]|uniref:hypothetical protein n=1 Tax=Acinetobacter sp. V2 TaxID=1051623 RepID=UPI00061F485D|nr:hypothetical protein [Acinetobacter sp. V2]KKC45502.1 hypothetical protein UC75_08555 [Acinetobacter sp. V2]
MKKLILFTFVALFPINAMPGVMYVYENLDGSTMLTSKKSQNPSMKLVQAKLTNNQLVFYKKNELEFEREYKNWVKAGKPKPALLMPEVTSKEIGFTGYVIFSLYEGKGLISNTPYNTDYTYNTYDDCISEGSLHIAEFKKSSMNRLNPNYIYPKNTRKEYHYRCVSEVVPITRKVFSTATLKKWEKQAIEEKEQEVNSLKKDLYDLEEAEKEIEFNIRQRKNASQSTIISNGSDKISTSQEYDENEKLKNKRKIIQLADGAFIDSN